MEKEKTCAITAARAAGALIRAIYATDYTVDYKGTDSPVTIADRNANQKIHEFVQGAFPADGWLSEETADSPARLSCRRVWVVDPLDGTKEFIQKIPEFAVSIALIEEGKPVVGVAYNPIQDRLFWAVRGQGAWCGEQRLHVSSTARLADALVLNSRSETKRGEWDAFQSLFRT
ncbi:MAG: 3'(2'),5'-bisphosphate nucleotidase CysQ, partial [Candidatus Binatia bacterium]